MLCAGRSSRARRGLGRNDWLPFAALSGTAALMVGSGCLQSLPDATARGTLAGTVLGPGALVPSPRFIIGRVIAIEPLAGFAFVELAPDAPAAAFADGSELTTRTLELKETGKVRASRYVSGHILGGKIVGGQPAAGDEVVWLAP